MSKPVKRRTYQRVDFSDEEVYQDIKDEIKEIRERDLKNVEEAELIYDLYNTHKQEKRKRKMMKEKSSGARTHLPLSLGAIDKDSSDDEEGEISEKRVKQDAFFEIDGQPSISNLGQQIRPLTLTRNRLVDLLNSRRFQQVIRGCFVRYLIDSNTKTGTNNYTIAQIVGLTEGIKEYTVNNVKTRLLLKLQETSQNTANLSLQMISNQHPPGGLEIQKWLRTNHSNIPKESQLKEKLQEHRKLLVEQLSSTEIDQNIWKKAKAIADGQPPKEDITSLIDFATDKLHNIEVQIDEHTTRDRENKDPQTLSRLQSDKEEAERIIEKLQEARQEYLRNRPEKKEGRREKKYSVSLAAEKRPDQIYEKVKARSIMMSTYEGANKIRSQIIESHMKYALDIDI